ncbi:TetR/AcrR family transcriptional regulator [Kribbella qitaiheensis]|uniref:TetR/AcrR family transcriptional regulator n=1 Tax=Kribbella qitaiheensis TaxID=1544730 RepID=UPI00361331F6
MRSDARRNRERLLAVAREAFAEQGMAVVLDDVARRAGVGPGTLYRHFPNREALFEAVMLDRIESLGGDAATLLQAEAPGDALFEFIGRLVEDAAAKADLLDALRPSGEDAVTTAADGLKRALGQLLERAQRGGDVRQDITTADLMALMTGVLYALSPRSAQRTSPATAVAVLVDGLRARPPEGS